MGEISKGISKNIKEKQNLEFSLGPPICDNIELHGKSKIGRGNP